MDPILVVVTPPAPIDIEITAPASTSVAVKASPVVTLQAAAEQGPSGPSGPPGGQGLPGPPGEGVADPGDLTLIFDNGLI